MDSLSNAVGSGGLITLVVGAFVFYYLKQRERTKAERRILIKRWRYMVRQVHLATTPNLDVGPAIQVHPDFASLKPHITAETRKSIYGKALTVVVGQVMAQPLNLLSEDIDRIEKKWKLP